MTTSYTRDKGRRFAFTVAAAFALLAAISFWRGRTLAPLILGALAVALFAAGVAVPAKLGPLERGWMRLAHLLSRVTTPIFMGIVYFVILTPIGFIRRTLASNPMVHRVEGDGYWLAHPEHTPEARRRRMERQF